jgi:glutaryl-CoA dehydrogenase
MIVTEEHKLVRDSARAWVKREVSPIIEEYAQKAQTNHQRFRRNWWFGSLYPEGIWRSWIRPNIIRLIMQEERGDSGFAHPLYNRL